MYNDCKEHTYQSDTYTRTSLAGSNTEYAHRLMYCLFNSVPISAIKGLVVMHTCDNPRCVNPYHLTLGTQYDNIQDKVVKGRQARGEGHGMTKLSPLEVSLIRDVYVPRHPKYGGAALAKRYGVSTSLISYIVNGEVTT